MKCAFVTGITGQDGAYLSRLLLEKGYDVHGLFRRSSTAVVSDSRLKVLGIDKDVKRIEGDLTDVSSLVRTLHDIKPDEIYNLGAQS